MENTHGEITTKVIVYPTRIFIENFEAYPYEDSKNLLKWSLSIKDEITHQYTFSAFMYDDELDTLIIPGGYNINKLSDLFKYAKFYSRVKKVMETKFSESPVPYEMSKGPRDIVQKKALDFLHKERSYQKYLALQTSQGKTYVAVNYIHSLNRIPIIIVDKKILLDQWIDRILDYTTLEKENIYIISGKRSIDKLYKMEKEELDQYAYFIAINRTIQTVIDHNPEEIQQLFDILGIGIKIYDEAHEYYSTIIFVDESTDSESLYLSATPSRSSKEHQKVYKNTFSEVPRYQTKVKKAYTAVKLYMIDSKCPQTEQLMFQSKRGFNVTQYAEWMFVNRFNMIKKVINSLLNMIYTINYKNNTPVEDPKKICILFKKLSHIDMVHEYLTQELFPESIYSNISVGIVTGKTKNREEELDRDIILSTDNLFGKAVDREDISILINFVPVGGKERTIQIMGRLRDKKDRTAYLVDIVDEGVEAVFAMAQKRYEEVYKKSSKNVVKYTGERYGS